MKRLVLIRHAKSSWDNPRLDDFDRPLNKRGTRDAPMMGERLAKAGVKPDVIVSSPANRAITTARVIADAVGYDSAAIRQAEQIYEASIHDLLDVIHQLPDGADLAFMFGHNPGFTRLSYHLSGEDVDNIPTCGVFTIDFPVESWTAVKEDKGVFVSFDFPKNVG